ncbi:hypothetical protein G6F58_006563 [Rhizopus delemar]|nr:hypothetical protein G6F58_006563 [Rhizopus delemar]
MDQFIHEDGRGKTFNDDGDEVMVLTMEVDDPDCPIANVTSYGDYLDLKPPEKPLKVERESVKKEEPTREGESEVIKKTYRTYKSVDMDRFYFLVNEKGLSVHGAAKQLKMPPSTADYWHKKSLKNRDELVCKRNEGSGRPVGRPPVLKDVHRDYLINLVDEDDTGMTLDQMMDSLTNQFDGLEIKKSAFHTFVKEKCRISCKKSYFYPEDRNCPDKIEERWRWVKNLLDNTDIDYQSNCIFIDEAGFHINLRRCFSWSRVGTRSIVKTPKTKAKMTSILGAISPHGVVNVKVRVPKVAASSKKRKLGNDKEEKKSTVGTVTGHYFNFIASTIDILDKYEEFKGSYLVMDNVPIHKNVDIRNYIESRGYFCVYLPPYSPELNPIEQFWSVCKSKLKREPLLENETLTSRIRDACNSVLQSDLQGFCRYSVQKFDACLNREPL